MKEADKDWKSFEDAFRAILETHKEFFGLEGVEPAPAKATANSGYVYDIEVMGYSKGDKKLVLFECRRKSRNLEPKDAGELAYRIQTTGAKKGYFVTTLEKGLAQGAKTIADYEKIGHIQLSANATPKEHLMKCLNSFFVGLTDKTIVSTTCDMHVVRTGVRVNDPQNVRITYVLRGDEHLSEIALPGTPHGPLLDQLLGSLNVTVEAVRAYCGSTLLEERKASPRN